MTLNPELPEIYEGEPDPTPKALGGVQDDMEDDDDSA